MKLVVQVDLEAAYGDRIEQVQESIERLVLLDERFRNELQYLIKQKLENGCFRIED